MKILKKISSNFREFSLDYNKQIPLIPIKILFHFLQIKTFIYQKILVKFFFKRPLNEMSFENSSEWYFCRFS